MSAYIGSFRENDFDGMLSTFAVETFVDHFDLVKYFEFIRSYGISTGYVPNISDYSRTLNVEIRRSRIVDLVRYQYLTLTGVACIDGDPILMDKDISGEEFLAENFATDDSLWLTEIRFLEEFLSPRTLSDIYYTERNQEVIARNLASYGGDEVQNVAARLEIAGEPYVLFMEVIRYGDRWYNLNLGGNLAILMGLSGFSGGLAPYSLLEN